MANHPLLRWLDDSHLPAYLKPIVAVYRTAAVATLENGAPGAEQTTALRKLVEAKDAAVRSAIEKHEQGLAKERV